MKAAASGPALTLASGLNVEPPDRTESVKIYGGGGEPGSDTNECAVCKPAHEREIAHRCEEADEVEDNTVRVRGVATAALGTTPILADDDDMETDEMGGERAVTLSAYRRACRRDTSDDGQTESLVVSVTEHPVNSSTRVDIFVRRVTESHGTGVGLQRGGPAQA